jgi:hypothetical protein
MSSELMRRPSMSKMQARTAGKLVFVSFNCGGVGSLTSIFDLLEHVDSIIVYSNHSKEYVNYE